MGQRLASAFEDVRHHRPRSLSIEQSRFSFLADQYRPLGGLRLVRGERQVLLRDLDLEQPLEEGGLYFHGGAVGPFVGKDSAKGLVGTRGFPLPSPRPGGPAARLMVGCKDTDALQPGTLSWPRGLQPLSVSGCGTASTMRIAQRRKWS